MSFTFLLFNSFSSKSLQEMFRFTICLLFIFSIFSPVKTCNNWLWPTEEVEPKVVELTTTTEKSTTLSMEDMQKQRVHKMVHQIMDNNWTTVELARTMGSSRSFFDWVWSFFGFGTRETEVTILDQASLAATTITTTTQTTTTTTTSTTTTTITSTTTSTTTEASATYSIYYCYANN